MTGSRKITLRTTCLRCKDLRGKPVEMQELYVKNKSFQHGKRKEVLLIVGRWCPICRRMYKNSELVEE